MNPDADDTWWKRLFTVVAFVAGGITAVVYAFASDADFATKIIGMMFMFAGGFVLVWLIKLAACYIIEGKRPPKNKAEPTKPPSN